MHKSILAVCLMSLALLWAVPAKANQAARGWCEAGAQPVVTSGLTSTTQVQQSIPQCQVTVFIHGGGIATIFSDNSGTPLANPFTAQTNGQWQFFAANGTYDVLLTFTGPNPPSPVTYSSVLLADPANQQAALPNTNLVFSSTPAFNATNNVSYTMTLTGNVTSSTVTGTPANGNLLSLTMIEDATGGRTFVFPVNFNLPLGFSFNTTALATNALTFKFDGTSWNLISNSGSGSGGNPGPPANSLQKNNGSGALAASAVVDNGIQVAVNENLAPKGPNPYIDATLFGVRALAASGAPNTPGTTASCISGSPNVSINADPGFKNGDGVVVYGCGPNTIAAPSGPTVQPSVSAAQTELLLDVNGPTGSTTYCYQLVAGTLFHATNVSPEICTNTGPTSLGLQTNTITTISLANNVATYTTSAVHGLVVGAHIIVKGSAVNTIDGQANGTSALNPFDGSFKVATVPDNTHFTVNLYSDTRNGAVSVGSGGTLSYWNSIHITAAETTNNYQYAVYGRVAGGTKTLIGLMWPQDVNLPNRLLDVTYLAFDDFGSTVTTLPNPPFYLPNLVPTTGTHDMLVTTICSGAGTTSLVLCANAGNTINNQTILKDDAGPFLTALNTGATMLPEIGSVVNSISYVFNSPITLPQGAVIYQKGTLRINEPISMNGASWYGQTSGTSAITSFANLVAPTIQFNTCSPCLFITNKSFFDNLAWQMLSGNGAVGVMQESGGIPNSGAFRKVQMNTGTGANTYSNMMLVLRGNGNGYEFSSNSLVGTQNGNFTATTPGIYFDLSSNATFTDLNLSGIGIATRPQAAGTWFILKNVYSQGNYEPFIGVAAAPTDIIASVVISVVNPLWDTTTQPFVANYGGHSVGVDIVNPFISSNDPIVTGSSGPANPLQSLGLRTNGATGGTKSPVNIGSEFIGSGGNAFDGTFGRVALPIDILNRSQAFGPGFSLFSFTAPPPAMTSCTVSAGGSVPVGATYYYYAPIYPNGSEGAVSLFCLATTTSGNQTVTLNWAAVTGVTQYNLYRGTNQTSANTNLLNCSPTTGTTAVDTVAVTCAGSMSLNPAGGPAGMQGSKTWTQTEQIGLSSHTSLATVLRNIVWPDLAGTPALINAAQTWSANQSVSNGTTWRFFGPNGVNWTALTGPGTNPASNVTFQLPSADSSGVQCISSNGSGVLSFSNCSAGTGTPGGSTKNLQFNSAATFGGASNLNYTTATGVLDLSQLANTNETITGHRFTDTTPTGNLLHFQNAALNADLFKLDVAGNLTIPAILTANSAALTTALTVPNGGTGAVTFTANQLVFGNGTSAFSPLVGSLAGTNPVMTFTSAAIGNVPLAVNTPASPTADLFDLNINSVKTSWVDSVGALHTPSTTYTGSGPIVLSGNGGACPSPATNTYLICLGDSGAGTGKLSNNGVTFKSITQFTNDAPTAHGVALATPTFPQISTTAAGGTGLPLVGQGSSADPIFTALGIAGGGTGDTTLTTHGVLVGEGTSAIAATAAGASGVPLLGQGASADPAFSGTVNIANGGTGATTLAGASIATVTGVITNGHCVSFSGPTVITDSGVAGCGGAGTPALSAITAGTASNTINSTVFPQTWNWALTGSTVGFKFGENTAATGSNNILLQATTATGSTAIPFQTDNNGNGYQLSTTGLWQPKGTGALAVPGAAHNLVVSQAGTTALTYVPPVAAGKVLIDNGPGVDPSFQDPTISPNTPAETTAAWTSATTLNSTARVTITGANGFNTAVVTLNQGSTITGGVVTFEVSDTTAFTNAYTASCWQPSTGNVVSTYTLIASTNQSFVCNIAGYPAFQVRLSTVISGTATVNVGVQPSAAVSQPYTTVLQASASNLAANVGQFGGSVVVTGTGAGGSGIPRVTISNDSSLAANQSVNVNQIGGGAVSTAATGVQKVGVVGNAGGIVDQAPGSAVPANVVMEGLSDGTNAQRALSDTTGRQLVRQYPDTTTTSYHASASFAGSSTTDNSVFPGNATNTAVLQKITVTCTQTTAGFVTLTLVKRSAADTGGTSATMTKVPDDSNYAAAVSAPLTYTGTGPSVGAGVGNLDVAQLGCNAAATAGPNDIYIFRPLKPVVLRGTAQQVAIGFGGAITGGTLTVTYEWLETTTP